MSQPLDELINEVRLFYQSLVQITEELHDNRSMSLGMRAVLEYLLKNGGTTVPAIARERRVTRQRIQALVNRLFDESLVETIQNPASKRSPNIALTEQGRKTILEMRTKEGIMLGRINVGDKRLRDTFEVLREVRLSIESGSRKTEKSDGRA